MFDKEQLYDVLEENILGEEAAEEAKRERLEE